MDVAPLPNAPMGLPIGRKVSWLAALASIISRVPSQSNACGVGLGGDAGVRVAHMSRQQALAPTRRARWGPPSVEGKRPKVGKPPGPKLR